MAETTQTVVQEGGAGPNGMLDLMAAVPAARDPPAVVLNAAELPVWRSAAGSRKTEYFLVLFVPFPPLLPGPVGVIGHANAVTQGNMLRQKRLLIRELWPLGAENVVNQAALAHGTVGGLSIQYVYTGKESRED